MDSTRWLAPWLALSVTSCSSPRERLRSEPIATPIVIAPRIPAEARDVLRTAAVTDDSFARRLFYSWTNDAGAARMREERRVLLPTDREGQFVAEIDRLAELGDGPSATVARMLSQHPSFAARRYAWTRPFATRVPLSDRSYGDRLVAIALEPNALIARFDARDAEPFRFVDLDGNEVPLGRVLRDPSTLAAVYHLAVHPDSGVAFREFVLCNESMIAEWSLGTPAIAGVIAADARAMRAMATLDLPDVAATGGWAREGNGAGAQYAAAIAFDTPAHRPTRSNLLAIASSLEAVAREDAPLVVSPAVMFEPMTPRPPPLPPLPAGVLQKPRVYDCS